MRDSNSGGSYRTLCRGLAVTFSLLLLTACATTSIERDHAPQFRRMAIVTSDALTGVARTETRADRAGAGIGVGATAGTVGGALVGAAACGPFLYGVCVVAYAAYGLYAGGIVGALYGFTGVSSSDQRDLTDVMSRLDQERDFQQELAEQLVERIPENLQTSPELADVQLVARLDGIDFKQRSRNNIRMNVLASLVFAWTDDAGDATHTKKFSVSSSGYDIDHWLKKDGQALDETLDESIGQLITDMNTFVMAQHSSERSP